MEDIKVTQLLRDDHKKVKGLFTQLEAASDRAPEMAEGVTRELYMELEIHGQLEKEIFYPAVAEATDAKLQGIVDQSFAAHQAVENLIDELRGLSFGEASFQERFRELQESVLLHIEEEEKALFPHADFILEERLEDLVAKMKTRRAELLASPKYENSQPGVVQNPNGGEQKRSGNVEVA